MLESASSPQPNVVRGRWLILSAALLWSLAGVFIKFLDVPPLAIVFYRSLFACLVFTPFVRRADWQLNAPVLISMITYTAAISSFVSANKLTTAANAIVLQYTAPIFVFLFCRVAMGEKVSRANGFALLAGMIGVAVISLDSAGEPEMAGVLLALLSGVLFAAYMVNLRRAHQVSPIYLTWINNAFCALALVVVVSAQLTLTMDQLLMLVVMGAVQLGLPYFLFSKGLQSVSLQEASLLALIEPVLNPLWVALTVGEIPSAATLSGGAVILIGLGVRYIWPLLSKSTERAGGLA
jgi:drug/metabolite transporter (DMT)-like permease